MATTLTQLRWQGAQWLRGIGLPGWVGLALGLVCAFGLWGLIEPMQADAQRLDADSDVLAQRAAAGALSKAATDATPQQQLAAFEQRFGGERTIAPSLARLQAAAQRRGFTLDQADFKLASEPSEPLARYSIQLPIKADYRALRRFSRDALREMPGLALDEVSLRRSDPKSPLLDAQLRFVLFLAKPTTLPTQAAATGSSTVAAAAAN
jgi:hypothetical protein